MKIAVLCGGRSNERDVSLSTGTMVAHALRRNGHAVVLLDACLGLELDCAPEEVFDKCLPIAECAIPDTAPDVERFFNRAEGFFGKNVLDICKASDIVFNALHGDEGENGKLQAAFDLLGISYTGTGSQGCLLAMNKALSKQAFHEHGIPTPESITFRRADAAMNTPPRFGFPCVVKPGSGGSSVGVSIVHNEEEYSRAITDAFNIEDFIIVERYIHGREFSVGILGETALPVIEIIPKNGFYDYKNKYQPGFTVEVCPAEISTDEAARMQSVAVAVFKALGLGAYARVDVMMDDTGVYCLEANTLPGMTPTSLLPQEAEAAGIHFEQLLETIIEQSIRLDRTE